MKSKQQKREEAIARAEQSGKLTPEQKLEKLDRIFGKGLGAKKERLKLSYNENTNNQQN